MTTQVWSLNNGIKDGASLSWLPRRVGLEQVWVTDTMSSHIGLDMVGKGLRDLHCRYKYDRHYQVNGG